MSSSTLTELIPVLQVAVGPVILISGVGLLLLSLTNRFGRAIDRSRQLARDLREASAENRQRIADQIAIIYRRAKLIQLSVIFGTVSVLLVAVLIITLFLQAIMKMETGFVIVMLFTFCLVSLIVSLIMFIMDIHLSLQALKLELGYDKPARD